MIGKALKEDKVKLKSEDVLFSVATFIDTCLNRHSQEKTQLFGMNRSHSLQMESARQTVMRTIYLDIFLSIVLKSSLCPVPSRTIGMGKVLRRSDYLSRA